MELYANLESLLEYSSMQRQLSQQADSRSDNGEGSDSLERLLLEKVEALSSILRQVSSEAGGRAQLSTRIIGDIEQQYCYLKTKLFDLYSWELGRVRNVEQRRSGLEKQLDELNKQKRQEQVECWRDIAELKREFRTWLKQYCDLMQRVTLVLPQKSQRTRGVKSLSSTQDFRAL